MANVWWTIAVLVALISGCVAPASETETNDANGDASNDMIDHGTYGATRILLAAPKPWYIEGLAVHDGRGFAGSAKGLGNEVLPLQSLHEPSRVFVFDMATGETNGTILVAGEDTAQGHGLAGLKTDAAGRIYAASTQLGILRFTETSDGWAQETYATLPDLPMCTPLASGACSPTPDDQPALGNDMTWDAAGNLYVTDSYQATVWRIPPGPGAAEVWYQHGSLDRAFGANGLRISPTGDRMFIAVCCPDSLSAGPIDRASRIVTVPFPEPGTDAPTDFALFGDEEGADGIAFGAHGDLYVVSNGGTKVIILSPDGSVTRTITNDDLSGEGRFDFPASIAFQDASMIIANYAITNVGGPLDGGRTVIEVYVADAGWADARPLVP